MTTAAEIRTAFAAVWADTTIKAYTDIVCAYDAVSIANQGGKHEDVLKKNTEFNFIQFRVAKGWTEEATQTLSENFQITVQYYRQADRLGTGYTAIDDFFDALYSSIRSKLGYNLSGKVLYWETRQGFPNISLTTINNVPVWFGEFFIDAFNKVSLC